MFKSFKKSSAMLLALALAAGNTTVMAENEYVTEWDLSLIYEDEAAWQADYDKAMALLDQYEEMRGTLNTVQGLYDYMEFAYGGELSEIESKLSLYANMGSSLDGTNSVYSSMQIKLTTLVSEESQANAYFDEELYEIPLEERQELINDPQLDEWYYLLGGYAEPDFEIFSEETSSALAVLGSAGGRSAEASSTILDVDMPDPEITLPDGSVIEMNDAEYFKIISNSSYDRELKKEAVRLRMSKVLPYINTLASLLEGTVLENWAYAQLNGYDSSREAALDTNNVESEIYDLLIESAHAGLEDFQRYLLLHKEGLGLDEQYSYDLSTAVSSFSKDETPFVDAAREVREALSILGEDYISYYDELMSGGYIDAFPSDYKATGAFSSGNQAGSRPYELFNYGGAASDISTIAHEMGHAIYTCYSQDNQPIEYSAPVIFTQEVASTTNEIIYYNYKMDHASSDDEKLFYLESLLRMFNNTFFAQTQYAEFEDQMYSIVENGESLDAEDLNERMDALQTQYQGDAVVSMPELSYFWAQIPHLHYNFYMYQYATSISYAASIYAQIAGEDSENAIENYKAFLKAGSSMAPSELLSLAGIDPLQEESYQAAMDYYRSLVDEYEVLIQNLA